MLTIEKALNAYAKMMNSFSIANLEPLLSDDLHYASQWVFEEITSKQAYLDYIAPKLLAIKNTDNKVFAEMGLLEVEFPGPCVVIAQGDKNNLVATVLIKVEDNKIKRIDMCAAPSPHSAKRTGIYPI
jgi:hypothetical protein